MLFLSYFLILFITSAIPILIYALRHCGAKFDFAGFLIWNKNRLFLGLAASLLFTILLIVLPIDQLTPVLAVFSLNINPSGTLTGVAAGVGLFIGASLVVGMNGGKS